MREIVAELSRDERRSELQVVQDIGRTTKDTVRLRAVVDGRTDGTMPLEDGAFLTRGARGLMVAAACATHEPRRAYHGKRANVVTEYLRLLSLGQTEIGSFVMTVFSPVPPGMQTTIALGDDAPETNYNRLVTTKLTTALDAVQRAAVATVATGGLDSFEKR